MEFDYQAPWYHGSPLKLSILHKGSTITQKRDLARIFSHKPTIVCISDDGQAKNNGIAYGNLYFILDEIRPEDIIPHPYTTMSVGDEWLTTRELRLQFLCATEPMSSEQLKDEDYAIIKAKSSE
jgi:hypothetical protein